MTRGAASQFALIGGSGFDTFEALTDRETVALETPYGKAAPITEGYLGDCRLFFMPRHGPQHKVPPHLINYRANLWALRERGARRILALNAVGGIHPELGPGSLVLPDQIVDYSYGRAHTFFDSAGGGLEHVDFTEPYDPVLRERLLRFAARESITLVDGAVYACTQGPRLESAAEVRRLHRDGCDVVGMTGMPEAALARELRLAYSSLAVVVNYAAGVSSEPLDLEAIFSQLQRSMVAVESLLVRVLPHL